MTARAHPEDELSALLDGELDADAADRVRSHVEGCPDCRTELDGLTRARTALRELPAADGSRVVASMVARHRRAIRSAGVFVAAVGLVLVGLGLRAEVARPQVAPDLDRLVAAHRGVADAPLAGMPGMSSEDPLAALPDPYRAPAGLIGSSATLSRQAVYDGDDVVAVVYRDRDAVVSIHQQPGEVEWSALPDGERRQVGGSDAWVSTGQLTIAIGQRGDVVVTVVSASDAAALTALAGMPEGRRTATWDRLHDACQRFVGVFSLGT